MPDYAFIAVVVVCLVCVVLAYLVGYSLGEDKERERFMEAREQKYIEDEQKKMWEQFIKALERR